MGNFILNDEETARALVKYDSIGLSHIPQLYTSSHIGPVYVSTQNVLDDRGGWETFAKEPEKMISHFIGCAQANDDYAGIIGRMSEYVRKNLVPRKVGGEIAVSGGMRRDLVYSAPVARELGYPHIVIFKNGKMKIQYDGGLLRDVTRLDGTYDIHISDLLNYGSSYYRVEDGVAKGWIPWLRGRGAKVNDSLSVVTRLQGGEEVLNSLDSPVASHSMVGIDEKFLTEYFSEDKYLGLALDYLKDPPMWEKKYLKENGALAFLDSFDPGNNKLKRAKRFVKLHGPYLKEVGKWDEIQSAVKSKYKLDLEEFL
jgi:hypothetical protein